MSKSIFFILIVLGICIGGCVSTTQQNNIPTFNATAVVTPFIPTPSQPVTLITSQEQVSFQKGLDLYQQEKYPAAIDAFNNSISANPENGEVYLARGKAYFNEGKKKWYEGKGYTEFNQAINDFDHALLNSSNKSEIYNLRGWSNFWIGYQNHIRYYSKGKHASPYYEIAARDFSLSLEETPGSVDALSGRALAYSYIGRGSSEIDYQYDSVKSDLARKDAKDALTQAPHNPWANYAMARVAEMNDKSPIEIIIKYLDEAIRNDPGEADFYRARGRVNYEGAKYDDALLDLNKAIELQPRFALAYNEIGVSWSRQSKWDESLVNYNKALMIDPDNSLYNNNFAMGKINVMNPVTRAGLEEALVSHDRAIELDPEFPSPHFERFFIMYNLNRPVEMQKEAQIYKSLTKTNEEIELARLLEDFASDPPYSNLR